MAHAKEQGAERFAFLGDFVGYGADPGWVVDLVREHVARGAIAVMGNHDAAVVQGPLPTMIPEARQVVDWTRARLDARTARLPRHAADVGQRRRPALRARQRLRAGGVGYVLGRMEAVRSLQATRRASPSAATCTTPKLFHLTGTGKIGDFVPSAGMPIPLSEQRRWLIIPGSAGQPRDGNPAACYASFDTRQRHPHLLPRALRHRSGRRQDPRGRPAAAPGQPARTMANDEENTDRPRRLEAGQVIDGFRLEERTHQGGMAHLWRVSRASRASDDADAADDEGAAHQGRRRPGHHRRLRGRADDHAGAARPARAEVHRQGRLHAPALHRDGKHCRALAARALRRRAAAAGRGGRDGHQGRHRAARTAPPARRAPGCEAEQHHVPGRHGRRRCWSTSACRATTSCPTCSKRSSSCRWAPARTCRPSRCSSCATTRAATCSRSA